MFLCDNVIILKGFLLSFSMDVLYVGMEERCFIALEQKRLAKGTIYTAIIGVGKDINEIVIIRTIFLNLITFLTLGITT